MVKPTTGIYMIGNAIIERMGLEKKDSIHSLLDLLLVALIKGLVYYWNLQGLMILRMNLR